jgi:hypothetical protein
MRRVRAGPLQLRRPRPRFDYRAFGFTHFYHFSPRGVLSFNFLNSEMRKAIELVTFIDGLELATLSSSLLKNPVPLQL